MNLKAPIGINLKITNQCNLICDHCLASSGKKENDELNTDQWIKIIDELKNNDVFFIDITGGEPLLHKDWKEIINYLISKEFAVSIATNGILLNEDNVAFLKSINPQVVKVSLDGENASIHQKQRKGLQSAFQNTLTGIKRLTKEKIPTTIVSTLCRRNIKSIEPLIKLAIDIGVNAVNFFPFIPGGRGVSLSNEQFTPDELKNLYAQIYDLNIKYSCLINFLVNSPLYNVWLSENNLKNISDSYYCLAGRQMLFIKENGDVLPCPLFIKPIGNLITQSLKDVWNSILFNNLTNNSFLNKDCIKCSRLNLCYGGCRAAAELISGNISEKDPFCWLKHD